jgi:hypothetical protein
MLKEVKSMAEMTKQVLISEIRRYAANGESITSMRLYENYKERFKSLTLEEVKKIIENPHKKDKQVKEDKKEVE